MNISKEYNNDHDLSCQSIYTFLFHSLAFKLILTSYLSNKKRFHENIVFL